MSDNTNNLRWIGDGSEGGELDVIDESSGTANTIRLASATQGTPFNARIDGGDAAHSYYEVKVTGMSDEASLGVGLVSSGGFQPGWKTNGYFYNGNITNGSAGLVIGFGHRIKEGDVVGVHQQRLASGNSQQYNIIFYHNGRCLGAGFSLNNNKEIFYPCLHVTGSVTVTFSTPPSPSIFEREQKVQSQDDPYSGDWAIKQAFVGPELGELPLPENSTFKVSFEKVETPSAKSDVQYHLSVKISNSFRTCLTITGKMEAFDKIEFAGHCMKTRMRPRPAFQKMEQLVGSALSSDGGLKKMTVSEQGQLIMSGPTAEIICSQFIETFEPVRSV